MLANLRQTRLVRSSHMRLPQDLGHADPLDVEVELRVVLEALGVVRVERVVRRESSDEGVEELVLAQGEACGGVVEREAWVVLEEAGFDLVEVGLLVVLVVRVLRVALSSWIVSKIARGSEYGTHELAVDGPVVVVPAELVVCP